MKKYLIIITMLLSHYGIAQTKKEASDVEKFNTYVTKHAAAFTFDGTTPQGDGWLVLEKLFAENQFVAWGEYHNSALFSQLADYALEKASGYGFKKWCVEVSPFVAAELTRIGKSPNPQDSIAALSKDHPEYGTFPFFKTKEDIRMVETALKHHYEIWGIDQEFQLAFPYAMGKVYQAQSSKVRNRYKGVYDSLQAKWWMPEMKLLDSLQKVTAQQKFRQVLSDIKISRTIYYESDNLMRATLMKKNFYRYYNPVATKKEKVFFKMGANHLAKGLNLMTHLYDMGNALYELTQRNETEFANVYFINRYYTEKGKIVDDLESADREYPKELLNLYNKAQWVVIDLRKFRGRYSNDRTLTEDLYGIIDKYDYIVVSPEIKN